MGYGLALVGDEGLLNVEMDFEIGGIATAIVEQPDGGKILAGYFGKIGNERRAGLARIDKDGVLDPVWNPDPIGFVNALAIDEAGFVYLGGGFLIRGYLQRNLLRVSGSGAGLVDSSWNPSMSSLSRVDSLLLAPNGDLIAGGSFQFENGQAQRNVVKFPSGGAGVLDATWNPEITGTVRTIAYDGIGSVYLAGMIFSPTTPPGRYLVAKVALNGSGVLDPDWSSTVDRWVYALTVGGDGSVYAGGLFTTIGGQPKPYIAKLSGSGSGAVDLSWNPSPNGNVYALDIGRSGELYAAGSFTTLGGLPRKRIARISAGTGSVDPNWDPAPYGWDVAALNVMSGGEIFAGGAFSMIGGESRNGLAALSPAGVAVKVSSPSRHAQIGKALTHQVVVRNMTSGILTSVMLEASASAGMDLASLTWTCTASAGSSCGTAGNTGSGPLPGSIDLASGGDVTFELSALVEDAPQDMLRFSVTATHAGEPLTDWSETRVVLFRNGFEVNGDGAN